MAAAKPACSSPPTRAGCSRCFPFPASPILPRESVRCFPLLFPSPRASFCHGFQRWWLCLVIPEHRMGTVMGMEERMGTAIRDQDGMRPHQ